MWKLDPRGCPDWVCGPDGWEGDLIYKGYTIPDVERSALVESTALRLIGLKRVCQDCELMPVGAPRVA